MSVATSHPRLRLLPLLIAMGVGSMAASVQAQSLVDLYTAARGYDATYQSAKLQFDATQGRFSGTPGSAAPATAVRVISSVAGRRDRIRSSTGML